MDPQSAGVAEYILDEEFNALEKELLTHVAAALPNHEGQLHSDLSLLAIVVGTLAGMLGSYIVNNIPTWQDAHGRLNREQVMQIEAALRRAVFRVDKQVHRADMERTVEDLLPDGVTDREALASQIVESVLGHLRPERR